MKILLRKLAWMLQARRRREELREELAFHLSEEADEHRAAGLTPDQAQHAARRDLGSVALVSDDVRAVWGWPLAGQFAQDFRHGVRSLVRSPGFSIAAIVTLGLGIGLTTAIFSIVYGMLLRPLAVNEPDTLMMLYTLRSDGQTETALSPPNFMSLHEADSRSFSGIAGFLETQLTLTGDGEAQRLEATQVSAGFFDVLATPPVLGRTFTRTENERNQNRVAVISHALWRQRFAGDPSVLGQTIFLNGISHTVVGVMPQEFDLPAESAVWVPLQYGNYFSSDSTAARKNNEYVRVIARLRTGISLEAARSELAAFARRLEERFPDTNRAVSFTTVPRHEDLTGEFRALLMLLFGGVGLVLVIASANVAGLLLARTANRQEEIAVRAALGAGRGRIVRQVVTESFAVGIGGNLLGLVVAYWVSGAIVAEYYDGLRDLDLVDAIRLDLPVLAFALGLATCSTILAGLFPALRATDRHLGRTLGSGGRTGLALHRGERLRSGLVVGQLALAVVLLVGSGLLLKSFLRLASVDPGFRTAQVLSFRIDLPDAAYRAPQRAEFHERLMERVARQPGVRSAGAISRLPIRMTGAFTSRFHAESGALAGVHEPSIGVRIVTPGYFKTMAMPLVQGREIGWNDRAGSLPIAVINEAAAKWMFPEEEAIGRRLLNFSYDPVEQAAAAFTIVGVVGDVRSRGLSLEPQPEVYFAHGQVSLGAMSVVVHTVGDPAAIMRGIRREIADLDANLPITQFLPIEEVLTDSLGRQRLLTGMLTLFSTVALVLAAVGIFGLVSFAVAQRTREIGVRIALGAAPRTVVTSVVRHASTLVVTGLTLGIAGALALTRVLESELFGVTPTDPGAYAGVTLILAATALVASAVPAWRAARVDPLIALRAD